VRLLAGLYQTLSHSSLLLLGGLAVSTSLPPALHAQGEDPSPYSDAWLIPEVISIQPGTPLTVAIYFEMEEGWHNYWQNAGDSGLPTEVEWDLPPGFSAGEIQWPVPERIVLYPLVDYGYSDRVALLVEISPPAGLEEGSTVRLAAMVEWLICKELCLPAYGEVEVELPVSPSTPLPDARWAELFSQTRASLPVRSTNWTAEAEVREGGYLLSVSRTRGSGPPPDSAYFYGAETNILAPSEPQLLARDGNVLTLELAASPYAPQPTPTLTGVLVAEGGGSWGEEGNADALWIEAPVAGAPQPGAMDFTQAPPPPMNGAGTLILAMAFAFLGGLLLNLMPCVFPVLSLKILGAAGQGGGDRTLIRNQGFAFGVGVMVSFLLLAGLLLALRAGGAQLGWGFQLQSPLFVAAMAALFFAIALNLMGVFEVGASLTRLGGKPGNSGEGYGEAVASGVLATIIATPCTAPFMGAAMGFALTRSAAETLLVFGFLGLGMALPYVVLSLSPGLLERLPKPGPWMETLKQLLAFPMLATVIWLVWVFGQQTGVGGATYLLSALLLVALAGWAVGRWNRTDQTSGMAARAVAVGALAVAALLVGRGGNQVAPAMEVAEGWQPFSQEEIQRTLASGQPVFLDFTAAWCLTCQVNERMVLSSEAVMEAFRIHDVALFKADWTRQDPAITEALEALGRNGVPVYALYVGGTESPPILLPAILTEEVVLDGLATHLSPS
jgi:thiol:disulfide interchange protein DsbD